MATRAEVEAAKKKQLQDGKKKKDADKGRKINSEKSVRKASSHGGYEGNEFIDMMNKGPQKRQKEAARRLQSKRS